MELRGLPVWSAVVVALVPGACHGRGTPMRADAATRGPPPARAVAAEIAALLLVDEQRSAKLLCLPEREPRRALFAGVEPLEVFDAISRNGAVTAAALVAKPGAKPQEREAELVLLSAEEGPRTLAKRARMARFSPTGDALAFVTARREHVGGGIVTEVSRSRVVELATGEIAELGEMADPRWEADGQHLRATRLTKSIEDRGARTAVRWTSVRVRWDRQSRTVESWGRGSAQVPAPAGTAVAWSEDAPSPLAPSHCAVRLGRGGHQHPIVGPFCMGIADDRGVRWSPDGQWLAFPRPGPIPGERKPGTFFIDVVGVEGGRYPALSSLYARVGAGDAGIAGAPGTAFMDWSPAQRFLALEDAAGDLRLYDFDSESVLMLGKEQKPRWSPGGGYLLVLRPRTPGADDGHPEPPGDVVEAFVRVGPSFATGMSLGPVRDIRWLQASACVRPEL